MQPYKHTHTHTLSCTHTHTHTHKRVIFLMEQTLSFKRLVNASQRMQTLYQPSAVLYRSALHKGLHSVLCSVAANWMSWVSCGCGSEWAHSFTRGSLFCLAERLACVCVCFMGTDIVQWVSFPPVSRLVSVLHPPKFYKSINSLLGARNNVKTCFLCHNILSSIKCTSRTYTAPPQHNKNTESYSASTFEKCYLLVFLRCEFPPFVNVNVSQFIDYFFFLKCSLFLSHWVKYIYFFLLATVCA